MQGSSFGALVGESSSSSLRFRVVPCLAAGDFGAEGAAMAIIAFAAVCFDFCER